MDESYRKAQQYLHNHNVLSLATCVDDKPWVSPVFYAINNSKLIFLSAPHTLHCRNIASNSNISASVQDDYKDWAEIKGLQLHGIASRVADADAQSVIDSYAKKFLITGSDAPPEIANALDKIHWYSVSVQKILFIDNSKGLGHRVELEPERLLSH